MLERFLSNIQEAYEKNCLIKSIRDDIYTFFPIYYLRWKINKIKYGSACYENPLKIFTINPSMIDFNGTSFLSSKYVGSILEGDWDLKSNKLKDEWMYEGLKERYEKEYEWEETKYYDRARSIFESRDSWIGYDDFESFKNHRLHYIDRLYERIKEDGYKTQSKISNSARDKIRESPGSLGITDEINCNISRDGELLLNDGIHRLSIAKILDLDEVPIQFIVRHKEWMEKRRQIADLPNKIVSSKHEDIINHPDIEDLIK